MTNLSRILELAGIKEKSATNTLADCTLTELTQKKAELEQQIKGCNIFTEHVESLRYQLLNVENVIKDLNSESLDEHLKKVDGKWALVSKTTGKPLRYYKGEGKPSKAWVSSQDRSVQYFKHMNESTLSEASRPRLLDTIRSDNGQFEARVYKNPEYNEYTTVFLKNGKKMFAEEGSDGISYSDSKEDALSIAKDFMRTHAGKIDGLEGPFNKRARDGSHERSLHYDTKEGKYYDRSKDMYLDHDESSLYEGIDKSPKTTVYTVRTLDGGTEARVTQQQKSFEVSVWRNGELLESTVAIGLDSGKNIADKFAKTGILESTMSGLRELIAKKNSRSTDDAYEIADWIVANLGRAYWIRAEDELLGAGFDEAFTCLREREAESGFSESLSESLGIGDKVMIYDPKDKNYHQAIGRIVDIEEDDDPRDSFAFVQTNMHEEPIEVALFQLRKLNEGNLDEVAPPDQEEFVKSAKSDFKKRYGKRWKKVLYATANARHNNEATEENYLEIADKLFEEVKSAEQMQNLQPSSAMGKDEVGNVFDNHDEEKANANDLHNDALGVTQDRETKVAVPADVFSQIDQRIKELEQSIELYDKTTYVNQYSNKLKAIENLQFIKDKLKLGNMEAYKQAQIHYGKLASIFAGNLFPAKLIDFLHDGLASEKREVAYGDYMKGNPDKPTEGDVPNNALYKPLDTSIYPQKGEEQVPKK